jgi:hypothetical protein
VIQFLSPPAGEPYAQGYGGPRTHKSKPELPKGDTVDETQRSPQSGAEAYARWLEHMQRSRTRHAAITRNLYTWSNYKSWADKMRIDWKDDGKA